MNISMSGNLSIDPAQLEAAGALPPHAAPDEPPAARPAQAGLDRSAGPLNPYRSLGFELKNLIALGDAKGAAAIAGAAARAANKEPATADSTSAGAALGAALGALQSEGKLSDLVRLLFDAEFPNGNLGDLPGGITAKSRVSYFVDEHGSPELQHAWNLTCIFELKRRVDAGG